MAPKLGQPMEFFKGSLLIFTKWVAILIFWKPSIPIFTAKIGSFNSSFFEGVSLPGVEYLPVLTGLFYLLVLLFYD